jgi:hypothetical protein
MTQARKRQSRSCGAFLAADHRQVICGACARRRIERAVNAPSLPDEFWTSPQLRKAFTARDFGKVIRAYLDARKGEVSQGDLARWLDVTQSLVSLVATGKRSVRDLHKLERWAIALRVPPAYLWFKLPPVDDSAEGDNVQRRQLLRSASILGVSAPVDFGYSTPSPVKAITRPDVAIIRETTQTFRKLDNQFGGGHSLSTVSTYLSSQVEPLLKRASGTDRERRELFRRPWNCISLRVGWHTTPAMPIVVGSICGTR